MSTQARPLTFTCEGDTLVGILHQPDCPERRAVVIVPGAPQYRVGSHRQFVLLAREICNRGFAVLRFDYRGMGDSDGEFRSFETVDADLRSAIDTLVDAVPEVHEVVLLGLCDGASACCFYAYQDPRVKGLVMINPWVRDQGSLAQAYLRHYYVKRLAARELWAGLFSDKARLGRSLRSFLAHVRELAATRLGRLAHALSGRRANRIDNVSELRLCDRVSGALHRYRGRFLLILSGADLTAREFSATVLETTPTRDWLERVDAQILRLEGANHTYSTASWRSQVHLALFDWLRTGLG